MTAMDQRIEEFWKRLPKAHSARLRAFAEELESQGITLSIKKQKPTKPSKAPHEPHLMLKIAPPATRPGMEAVSIMGMLPDGSLYLSGYANRIGAGQRAKDTGLPVGAKHVKTWKISDDIWDEYFDDLTQLHAGFHAEGTGSSRRKSFGHHVDPSKLSADDLHRIAARIGRLVETIHKAAK